MKWLERITEYYRDKVLAAKCGLGVKDICVHESGWQRFGERAGSKGQCFKCEKCGEFYK